MEKGTDMWWKWVVTGGKSYGHVAEMGGYRWEKLRTCGGNGWFQVCKVTDMWWKWVVTGGKVTDMWRKWGVTGGKGYGHVMEMGGYRWKRLLTCGENGRDR